MILSLKLLQIIKFKTQTKQIEVKHLKTTYQTKSTWLQQQTYGACQRLCRFFIHRLTLLLHFSLQTSPAVYMKTCQHFGFLQSLIANLAHQFRSVLNGTLHQVTLIIGITLSWCRKGFFFRCHYSAQQTNHYFLPFLLTFVDMPTLFLQDMQHLLFHCEITWSAAKHTVIIKHCLLFQFTICSHKQLPPITPKQSAILS